MRRLLVLLLVTLASAAAAADVVVHPFRSQDPVIGVALAERVAGALGGVDVLGPELAPTLVAPIVVPGGFVNPLALLPSGPYDRSAVALLAGAVGVPVAVSGSLVFEDAGLRLDLVASVDGELHSQTVTAPGDDLDLLVRRAAPVVAFWAGARPLPPRPLDMRGQDEAAARARALIGAGFVAEAMDLLDALVDPHPTDARLRDDLRLALEAGGGGDPALAAMVSLGAADPAVATAAFARWRAEGGPPVADVWSAAWARSVGDDAEAERSFGAAGAVGAGYPYGRAALAADLVARGDEAGARDLLGEVVAGTEPAALLAAAFAASALEDPAAEDAALAALGRAAPFFVYPFERRSFLAFDRDDALTAAEVLVVALELEPESDLYWTNLGWAWYLLGLLERSEAASLRALELDAGQFIARYNLGLARVVTGRLDEALDDYEEAVRFDPDVDREAIADLVVAEEAYPDVVGVPFALGFLLERAGDRDGAADAFERFLERAAASGTASDREREARDRVAALRAPLPPIEIAGAPALSLARRGAPVDEARPGDPLTVTFEVTTPGDALPRRLDLSVELTLGDGEALAVDDVVVDVPLGAIGYVIDALVVELPLDLEPGTYTLTVRAAADDLEARADRDLVVAGEPDVVRRLIGRGLVLTGLDTGQTLVGPRDLGVSADVVVARLLAELTEAATLADEALPMVETGRFAGMSGGEVFAESTSGDVGDFLGYLLESGASSATFVFVDAYAQWVLDGSP